MKNSIHLQIFLLPKTNHHEKLTFPPFVIFTGSLLLFSFALNSCLKSENEIPAQHIMTSLEPRNDVGVWPDSVFEVHNEYILWVFENYLDSVVHYANDPVDFMEFASRMSLAFSDELFDCSDILDGDTLIIPSPYYIKGAGFTYEDIDNGLSQVEMNSLHVSLDSIEDAINNASSEVIIQGLIHRAIVRAEELNSSNEDLVINCLKQASYSLSLLYDLNETYGDPGLNTANFIICFIRGLKADVCTIALMNSEIIGSAFDNYSFTEKVNLVREISLYAISICYVDC